MSGDPPWLTRLPDGIALDLYIAPRASRTQVCGTHDGRLKLQVAAPPVDGAANKEIVAFIARWLGVARGDVSIASGEQGKRKRVIVRGGRVDIPPAPH